MKILALVCMVALVVLLASCTPGPNALVNSPDEAGKVAGFWQGLWHGLIVPITFILSLFSRNILIYEVPNNGAWYNFGYLLGVTTILGGGGRGSAARRSRDK
jgi:hypothetical protein